MTLGVRLLPLLVIASVLTASGQVPTVLAMWRAETEVKLFEGRSLERWTAERVRRESEIGRDKLPKVVDGAIQLTPRAGWTRTKEIYRNFRLTFSYRFAEQAAGALYFRTWPRLDKTGQPTTGSFVKLPNSDQEWHDAVLDCRDHRAEATVDGTVIAVSTDITNSAGFIGLRAETGRLEIRDVVLTPLTNESRKLAGNRIEKGGAIQVPKLLREVKPQYTEAAMRERIQGAVWMDVTVLEDGTVGDVLVVNSLDRVFGLDAQAEHAVKAWTFRPATRDGTPVPVVVTVEMTFRLK